MIVCRSPFERRSAVRRTVVALCCGACCLMLVGCGVSGNDPSALAAVPPPAAAVTDGDGERSSLQVDGETVNTVPARPTVEIPKEWPSEVEALFGRYWLYWEAFAAAYGPPNADPSFEPLQELSTPENWTSLQTQLRGFAEDGMVLVLPERSVTEHLIRIPNATVLDSQEGAEAVIQDCWIDDFVQQTVSGDVVAETKEAKLMNVTMKVLDGSWRVAGVTRATPDADGYDQCLELSP